MEIYVKATSNCPEGMPLTHFEELGPSWEGESVVLPFGEGDDARYLTVVGWTDLFTGRPCPVTVQRVCIDEEEGYLVRGGNSGVRVLDDEADVEEWDAHLPPGYGQPVIWVADPADLPDEVRAVVEAR